MKKYKKYRTIEIMTDLPVLSFGVHSKAKILIRKIYFKGLRH